MNIMSGEPAAGSVSCRVGIAVHRSNHPVVPADVWAGGLLRLTARMHDAHLTRLVLFGETPC